MKYEECTSVLGIGDLDGVKCLLLVPLWEAIQKTQEELEK